MDRRLKLIEPVKSYDDIAQCDVVIEAVFERIPVKEEVFKKLDEVMKPGALLYTNTSGIDIDIMANATKRPQDVAGTHFFAPANVMKLFEVVKGTKSAPDTLATGMALGRKIGKISAMAGNGDGFVANRSRGPFGTEMNLMVEEGALPEQVDKVMVDFGYPIGPFATADLSGLDIGYDSRQRRAAENPNYRKMPIADMIVEAGRLGQKTGAGWFRYEKGDRTPHPDPELARMIKEKAAELGIPQRSFSDEEILRRLLFASVNEACKILEEGKAYRASDIDVMWLNGFGFPRYRGGLMYWADTHRRRRGLPPDPGLAPAIRRALGPRQHCCAVSPKPAPRCAKQSPAGQCEWAIRALPNCPNRADRRCVLPAAINSCVTHRPLLNLQQISSEISRIGCSGRAYELAHNIACAHRCRVRQVLIA